MPTQASPPREMAPPLVPAMPRADPGVKEYLTNFALWCSNNFRSRPANTQALPFILLQASDPVAGVTPKVFKIQVSSAGAITATSVPLGTGPT
jgi:hypothetical protein